MCSVDGRLVLTAATLEAACGWGTTVEPAASAGQPIDRDGP